MFTSHSTKYIYEKKVERENITGNNIEQHLNFSVIMKNKKRKKRRAIWIKDWLKRRGKGSMQQRYQ